MTHFKYKIFSFYGGETLGKGSIKKHLRLELQLTASVLVEHKQGLGFNSQYSSP